ncbi:hypothetical protein ROLI_001030 [Roseobacter fucihabitans]|uniref:Uncharacterized protein n=2 Tax=Roseobacter fucihabitans TaxID=1537242 RepID=A0ABZ2BLM4_9RHOB|nr:hypothetical protein [Roseobacter litoralis]
MLIFDALCGQIVDRFGGSNLVLSMRNGIAFRPETPKSGIAVLGPLIYTLLKQVGRR